MLDTLLLRTIPRFLLKVKAKLLNKKLKVGLLLGLICVFLHLKMHLEPWSFTCVWMHFRHAVVSFWFLHMYIFTKIHIPLGGLPHHLHCQDFAPFSNAGKMHGHENIYCFQIKFISTNAFRGGFWNKVLQASFWYMNLYFAIQVN